MTLIIGVKCEDGVVIGADSIRTFRSSRVEQEVSNKIQVYDKDVVIGSAGTVGLSQLIKDDLSRQWTDIKQQERLGTARNMITDAMLPQIFRDAKRSKVLDYKFQGSAHIIAFPLKDKHVLLQYSQAADSVEITLDSPFTTVGAGSLQADPFLAFVRRTFWNNLTPRNISEGIFGVLWTLDHVSMVNAGLGVGGRSRVAVLQKEGSEWVAEFISDSDLDEHKEAIFQAEDKLLSFRNRFNPDRDGTENKFTE